MNITTDILIKLAEKYNHGDIDFCTEYGERGYSTSKPLIVFSNWNRYPKHVTNRIEYYCEVEWSDEWYIDHDRSRAYRTQPDCYDWTPSTAWVHDQIFTVDDANDNPHEWLEWLHNDSQRCDLFNVLNHMTAANLGYELITDDYYEIGHHGTNDDPTKILEELLKQDPKGIFVFGSLRNEQFRSTFKVWKKLTD